MATTIYRLAEEIQLVLSGGVVSNAFNPSIDELKISVAQVANTLFKIDYYSTNLGNAEFKEVIPNGAAIGTYEGITVEQYGEVSKATLPAMPLKLPRNMGVWSIYPSGHPEMEFIPLQMGQSNLLRSQVLLNDLMGQVGYETHGLDVVFTKDLTLTSIGSSPITSVDVKLGILDFSTYSDWDVLPLPAEQEWEIKKQVIAMYANKPTADKVVDPSVSEQTNTPINKQRMA